MKVIFLNGPPRSGKNTAANMLAANFRHCAIIGFSHHLKRLTHGIYLGREGWDMDPDAFDAVKSVPQELLGWMSWREAYIHYSEKVIKPLHGKGWFGEQFVRAARSSCADLVIVPDSGFREEVEEAVRVFGPSNTLLIRLRKEGCSFSGDSRSYISLEDIGVREESLINIHGEESTLRRDLAGCVERWLA